MHCGEGGWGWAAGCWPAGGEGGIEWKIKVNENLNEIKIATNFTLHEFYGV